MQWQELIETPQISSLYQLIVEGTLLSKNFKEFVKSAWHIVEKRAFVDNWHIDCICDHLQACAEGKIKKLIINIPPRHTKSLLVSVFFPAWIWTRDPTKQFLCASYDETLSTRDSVKTRSLIEDKWFRDRWEHLFQLTKDQNQKTRFSNSEKGYRYSISFGGKGTGDGGDYVIVDDPHNTDKVMSDAYRGAAIQWHDLVLYNRVNDEKDSVKIYVGQRSHFIDLFGHIIKNEGDAEVVNLPMEYEGVNCINTSLDWVDKRTEKGEILNPKRFNEQNVIDYKKKGVYFYASQYQQRPAPLEGGLLNIDWFRSYTRLPPKDLWIRIIQSWDTAQKPDEVLNDPWVGGTWLESKMQYGGIGYYLLDVCRKWMNYPTGKKEVLRQAAKWSPATIIIEDKSTGSSLLQELPLQENWKIPLLKMEPESDKLTRMSTESSAVESGMVFLPDNDVIVSDEIRNCLINTIWIADFLLECSVFPNSETDDQVDMLSQSLRFFRENTFVMGKQDLLSFIGNDLFL